MGAVNTTYTFTATDTITSTKMNNIIDQTTMTSDAVFTGGTIEVVSGKLRVAAGKITSNEIASNSVNTDEIVNSAVTTAKIADGAITTAKLSANLIVDSVPSNFPIQVVSATKTDTQIVTSTTTSWTDVSGLSITLTRAKASASGKIRIQAVIPSSTNNNDHGVAFRIIRGSTVIGVGDADGSRLRATSNSGYAGQYANVPGVIDFIDTSPGSSATVTYKIQAKVYNAATGYINRTYFDTDAGDYEFRTISTMTLTELSP